jgi:class 3 adenylate cyclase/tetratricopeptide (TPR) repeat protein
MKCSGCGHDNRDAAKFCEECAAPLGRKCAGCGAELRPVAKFCDECAFPVAGAPPARSADPRSYTPKHLAEKILSSRSALAGERKQVTVLFVDVKGSQELARSVGEEVWHQVLDRYFEILADGVHRFEGTVNQYTGDGVMALFGAPIAHEDHAQRSCFAALAVRDELASFSAELRRTFGLNFSTRMGLNSGEVVVGRIGDDLRMDYTAQGHTVGLAARMQALAEPGKIYLTEMTGSLVAGFFELKDLGRFSIKGEERNLRVYELRSAGRLRTRFDVARERGFSPFVGRDTEMGLLEGSLAAALSSQGHAVGVVSEAGIGKSRLCWEFAERCRSRGITVLEARGMPQGRTTSLLPILELFRAYFGLCEDDDPGMAREKVAEKLVLLEERLPEALPRIFELLRIGDGRASAPRSDPEARRRELSRLLADLVRLRSAREALVIVGEDLQWWDAASERMLEGLVEFSAKSRALLVLNWRPEHRPDVRETAGYREIVLGPLPSEATRSLVTRLLGDHPSVASLVERIVERSEGNPFFVEEVIRAMTAGGQLKGEEGDYRTVRPVDEIVLPATVQAVIDARIDALSERDKTVLQAAAVLGKEFSAEVLERVAGLPAKEVEEALESLAENGLIVHLRADGNGWQAIAHSIVELFERIVSGERGSEDLYAFRHSLLHEVAYRSQLAQHRSRLHAEVAHALEGLAPEHADERAALIGHHLERAGDLLAAARWYTRAARWEGSEDPAEALRWWQKVRLLVGEIGDTSDESLTLSVISGVQVLNLSWRLGIAGDEVKAIFEETRAAAERTGRPEALAGAIATFGVVRGMAGHVRESLQHLREATRLVAGSENVGLRLSIAGARAYAEAASGELAAALATADEALEQGGGDLELGADLAAMRPVLFLIALRGFVLTHSGRLGEAREALERALAASDEERDSEVVGWIHGWKVQLAVVSGADEHAMEDARRGSDIAERNGSQFSQVIAHSYLGRAHLLRGECAEAASALEKALALARKRRTALETEPEIVANLAQAVLMCGDPEKAVRLAEEAVEMARSRGARLGEAIAGRILGSILAGAGRKRAARRSLERALELAREVGARSVEPFAHLGLAEVARLAEDEKVRADELVRARELFGAIGAEAHAERVEVVRG